MLFGQQKDSGLEELFEAVKRYLLLQKSYIELELVTKLTLLCSALILAIVLFVLGMIVVLYLSFTLAVFLTEVLGNSTYAFLIVTGGFALLCALVYWQRKAWIIRPVANFLVQIFHNKQG